MQWYESVITVFPFWIIKLRCHRTVSETIETQTQQGERGQTTDSTKLSSDLHTGTPVHLCGCTCVSTLSEHTHKIHTHTMITTTVILNSWHKEFTLTVCLEILL